jgi:hypothetical protein
MSASSTLWWAWSLLLLFAVPARPGNAAAAQPASSPAAPAAIEAFADSEYAPYRGPGDAAVEGRIAYGKHAANGEIYLDPVTPHSRSALEALWREEAGVLELNTLYWRQPPASGEPPAQPEHRAPALLHLDPRALAFRRVAAPGKHGSFEFAGLPPGDYYLWTRVTWATESGGYFVGSLHNAPEGTPGYLPRKQSARGIWMHRLVRLAAGDRARITISR